MATAYKSPPPGALLCPTTKDLLAAERIISREVSVNGQTLTVSFTSPSPAASMDAANAIWALHSKLVATEKKCSALGDALLAQRADTQHYIAELTVSKKETAKVTEQLKFAQLQVEMMGAQSREVSHKVEDDTIQMKVQVAQLERDKKTLEHKLRKERIEYEKLQTRSSSAGRSKGFGSRDFGKGDSIISSLSDLTSSLVSKVFGVGALSGFEKALSTEFCDVTGLCLESLRQCIDAIDPVEEVEEALKQLRDTIKEKFK